jgi:hypothetical protein
MLLQVEVEFVGRELSTVVAAQSTDAVALSLMKVLCVCHVLLESIKRLAFVLEEFDPHVAAVVVHDEDKIPGTLKRWYLGRSP